MPSYWNLTVYDPFTNLGVGTGQTAVGAITGVTGVRASNSIQYLYGHSFNAFGGGLSAEGLNFALMSFGGENASNVANDDDGSGFSTKVGWTGRNWSVSAAYGRTNYLAGDVVQSNIAGAYDFGVARVLAHIANDKNGALSGKGYLLGATVPVGVGVIRASYAAYETDAPGQPGAKKFALGYVHHLSRRTAVYATGAILRNEGGATFALNQSVAGPNSTTRGFDLGIRHSF